METKIQETKIRRRLLRALEKSLSRFSEHAREDHLKQESCMQKVLNYAGRLQDYASGSNSLKNKIVSAYRQIGVLE